MKTWALSQLGPNGLSARFAIDRYQDVNIDRLFFFNIDRWSCSMVSSDASSKYLQNAQKSSFFPNHLCSYKYTKLGPVRATRGICFLCHIYKYYCIFSLCVFHISIFKRSVNNVYGF